MEKQINRLMSPRAYPDKYKKSYIITYLRAHGLERNSRSWPDYEYGKVYIWPLIQKKFACEYEFFTKTITDFLGL